MPKTTLKKAVAVFCIMMMSISVLNFEIKEVKAEDYTEHQPIKIYGDENFTEENGVKSGEGTKKDPFIIENLKINAISENGIEIRNTNKYFTIRNCNIIGDDLIYYGIYFVGVKNGSIENSAITKNGGFGIAVSNSKNIQIISNNVYKNGIGIYIISSKNITMRDNVINENRANFGITGTSMYGYGYDISQFYHDIDTSNKINGKPIKYIQNQSNLIFDNPKDIGFLGFVSCKNITVKNFSMSNNVQGILFANTTNSFIENSNFYNNSDGIYLSFSSNNNLVSNNNIYANKGDGINILFSNESTIKNNKIYENAYSIFISFSDNNQITNNEIYKNNYAMSISFYSYRNKVYLNDFIDNKFQATDYSDNDWDYNKKGNYWSDYKGEDKNNDGIGDTPYSISGFGNSKDNYPLMKKNFDNGQQQNQQSEEDKQQNFLSFYMIIPIIIILLIIFILFSYMKNKRNKSN